ncbi:MAG TPA: hypothetical protein VM263_05860 [Acidimicrobiales bacterium]|nr:hypothetical protein [Acidimicrobiales bacterium]
MAAAATVVVALALADGDGATRLETGPAAPSAPTSGAPPPPPSGPAPPGPGAVLATGTAANGRAWTLSIGGPTGTLCLAVELDERIAPQTCAGRLPGAPVPEADYRPLLTGDVRVPRFVFGRAPSGTAEVVVELAPPAIRRSGRVITVDGEAEPFYVVELAPGESPTAVVALGADGGTSRHPVGG